MKRNISEDMTRDQVVASMAKKLANTGGATDFVGVRRRKFKLIYVIYLLSIVILVSITGIMFSLKKPAEVFRKSEKTAPVLQNEPLLKMKTAFREKSIDADQFSLYMRDLLIRYDSLPENFKLKRPIIRDTQVYNELLEVWPKVSLKVRSRILNDLPGFEKKLNAKK